MRLNLSLRDLKRLHLLQTPLCNVAPELAEGSTTTSGTPVVTPAADIFSLGPLSAFQRPTYVRLSVSPLCTPNSIDGECLLLKAVTR